MKLLVVGDNARSRSIAKGLSEDSRVVNLAGIGWHGLFLASSKNMTRIVFPSAKGPLGQARRM
jgi:hypothetical protein